MNGRHGGGGWKNGRTLARFQGLSCVEESQVVRNIWNEMVYVYICLYTQMSWICVLENKSGTKGTWGPGNIRNAHFTIEADDWTEIKFSTRGSSLL